MKNNINSLRKKEKERNFPANSPVFNRKLWKSLWKTLRKRGKEGKPLKYSHMIYCCPYYDWDAKTSMHCEGGRIEFPDRPTAQAYFETYCGDVCGWKRCTVARAITRFYEAQEEAQGKPCRG